MGDNLFLSHGIWLIVSCRAYEILKFSENVQENYSDIGSAPDQRYFSLAWSSYMSRN